MLLSLCLISLLLTLYWFVFYQLSIECIWNTEIFFFFLFLLLFGLFDFFFYFIYLFFQSLLLNFHLDVPYCSYYEHRHKRFKNMGKTKKYIFIYFIFQLIMIINMKNFWYLFHWYFLFFNMKNLNIFAWINRCVHTLVYTVWRKENWLFKI